MTKRIPSTAFAVTLIFFVPALGVQPALARPCRAEMPSHHPGQWWSYRLIDGRKCWYEGKPMLSKALLEWSRSESTSTSKNAAKEVRTVQEKISRDPLEAQAWAPKEPDTFEAMWQARIKQE